MITHKKAMVIGGGVAGIQAALDLADMGVETYLIEKGPSVGGRMAQLDKTFPTNDCAMCILSPKLVEVGSHPYINIITLAEVIEVQGKAPELKVKILKHPRYVDESKCTGCGICMEKCPSKMPDPYNKGISQTKAIRIPFPQAGPAVAVIDHDACIYHQRGKCRNCERVCDAKAIDFGQQEEIIEMEVGAIVMACGTREFNAKLKGEYGYGIYPNVMTSIEYERILSASGPSGGHVTRPSDGKEPGKIAILQCVGSRDSQVGNDHCSAVCCMQAAKDAVITQEHLPNAQTTIFYMDIRAYGKGFDRFIDQAKNKHATNFICGRISSVESDPVTNDLSITYVKADGHLETGKFDLLVLSVGLEPSTSSKETAALMNVCLDNTGFVSVDTMNPVNTSCAGIFVCGSVSGPKDIPESVIEASGAASAAAASMGHLKIKEIVVDTPEERDLRGESPRTGVIVCRCGINIASTVDVPNVVEYAATLPGVKYAAELLFSCAQDSQKVISDAIREHGLNRLVVAACTPRTHEHLFQKTLQQAGVNPYMFEFANIREHCAWVHQKEKEKATEKAKDLVRAAVAKVKMAEPLYKKELGVDKNALIIGGGLAGMTAALDLADQGFGVHLVEKEAELGGNLKHVLSTLSGKDTAVDLESLIASVKSHDKITVYTESEVSDISGFVGNFKSKIGKTEVTHGVVIVAAGGEEYTPKEYGFGKDGRIVTQRKFETMLHSRNSSALLSKIKSVVMIQCVGSRDEKHDYCSRVCCSHALKNAIRVKDLHPGTDVYILFRDIRSYGLREKFYREARRKGVTFLRFDENHMPQVFADGVDLAVSVSDEILGKELSIHPDMLVLSAGITANPENRILSQMLKVPLGADGFFLEAHVKLRPVDFATDGIFVCGLSHYPKDIGETISQARAAAGRAATVLSKSSIESEGKISRVRTDRCSGCGTCEAVCAYNAVEIDQVKKVAVVNEALCKGCGACAASCRSKAIDLCGFNNEQILEVLASI